MSEQQDVFGFLTVVESAQHGVFGGYLVVNATGRPVEFHCTAPIRPSRAQEILYGATLRPYLYGEQIGKALLDRSKQRPAVICTDQRPVLALRAQTNAPVAVVLTDPASPEARESNSADDRTEGVIPIRAFDGPSTWEIDATTDGGGPLIGFTLERNQLAIPADAPHEREAVEASLKRIALMLDLAEPFERIREALSEARRAA